MALLLDKVQETITSSSAFLNELLMPGRRHQKQRERWLLVRVLGLQLEVSDTIMLLYFSKLSFIFCNNILVLAFIVFRKSVYLFKQKWQKKDLCLILCMTSITYDKFEGLSPSVWLVFQGPVSKIGKKTRDQPELNWMKIRPQSWSFQGPGQSSRGLFDILKLRKPPKKPAKTGLSTNLNIKCIYNRCIILNFSFILSP